jgi:isoamylase
MFLDQSYLVDKGLKNYWGYDTIGFFALDPRYLCEPTIDEFKGLVDRMHALLATLLLSQGTPMVLAGDEFGRTQQGNNNAYCQDNEISWIDWEGIDDAGHGLRGFTRRLLAMRRDHPVLRRSRFLTGEPHGEGGYPDVTWLAPDGQPMSEVQWNDAHTRSFAVMLDGRSPNSAVSGDCSYSSLLLVFNAWEDGVTFTLPAPPGRASQLALDTADPEIEIAGEHDAHAYTASARSLLVFVSAPG